MSRLEELLSKMCPNGVPFVKLGTLGTFENIGVDKKTIPNEPLVQLLNYVDVYKNKYIDRTIPQMTVSAPIKKIEACSIHQWDIFVTPTSETRDDIGHSSVATEDIPNAVYSYHIMRLRLNAPSKTTACFINYLFESLDVQKQIFKFASGQTRFGLSKYKFADIVIPYPPIEVQEEIVKILDRFADYAAELQAELQARKEQYEYYRNLLLTFSPSACGCGTDDEQKIDVTTWGGHSYEITWKTMGEICTKTSNIKWKDCPASSFRYIDLASVDCDFHSIAKNLPLINSSNAPSRAQQIIRTSDVLFGTTRPTLMRSAYVPPFLDGNICSTGYAVLRTDSRYVLPRYLYFILNTRRFSLFVENNQEGAGYPSISFSKLHLFSIPVPPLELQEKIVAILDKFEALTNDLQRGLPAEIEAVGEQYEYYRDKLLSFKKIV